MILVLNCGSQSIRWKVFDRELKLLGSGEGVALKEELKKISAYRINLIGHRVVHGGGIFTKPTKINEVNLQELEKLNHFAPLHNPLNIAGIKACQKIFPQAQNFAVFDTEFFVNLPEKACTYALPENLRKELGLRRYGFHGISHEYIAKKVAAKKIISVHLGGGSSITAIKDGRAIDTSMGFTPMEGLVMMTRPGNIDAGIVIELIKNIPLDKVKDILNKESGIKGICGQADMIRVLEKAKVGDKRANLALDVFVYSIQKYIGAYFAILDGCDALVFTGSIGFGSKKIRNMVCKDLKILSKTKILAIKTDEELAIAKKIFKL